MTAHFAGAQRAFRTHGEYGWVIQYDDDGVPVSMIWCHFRERKPVPCLARGLHGECEKPALHLDQHRSGAWGWSS